MPKAPLSDEKKDNAVWDTLEHRPLTDDDKKAGVQRDMVVRLGCKNKQDDLTRPVLLLRSFVKAIAQDPENQGYQAKRPSGLLRLIIPFYL